MSKASILLILSALVFGALNTHASAQLAPVYIAHDSSGHEWALYTGQVGNDVYLVGEKAVNFHTCFKVVSVAPSERKNTNSLETDPQLERDTKKTLEKSVKRAKEEAGKKSKTHACSRDTNLNRDSTAFVFKGRRVGSNIKGTYWYVPKGSQRGSGSGVVTIEANTRPDIIVGDNLRLDFAELSPSTFVPVSSPTNVWGYRITTQNWPLQRRLGYPVVDGQMITLWPKESDLTGIWFGDDGGRYYIQQSGDQIVWFGEHPDFAWSNVAVGKRQGDIIEVEWIDVGKGATRGQGTMTLRLGGGDSLQAVTKTGGSGGGNFERGNPTHVTVATDDIVNDSTNYVWRYPLPPSGFRPLLPRENPRGDRDFDGSPEITISVSLRTDRKRVFADVSFEAVEIGGDGTIARGDWKYPIYKAPPHRQIQRILSPTSQSFSLTSEGAAAVSNNGVEWSRSFPATGVLAAASGIGDTGGDDISDNNNDAGDTHIKTLLFNPIKLELVPAGKRASTETTDRVVSVVPTSIGPFCPIRVIRGDRDFSGRPRIFANVRAEVAPDNRSIIAQVGMAASETKSDWTSTTGSWRRTVYTAPPGERIDAILSDTRSQVGDFFSRDGVNSVTAPTLSGGLARRFEIVGDTGGDDISDDTNCNDDTRISVIFNPMSVRLTSD